MKILLVSDNKEVKELLSFHLTSHHPITVRECSSAREAVEILSKEDSSTFGALVAPYNGQDSVILQHLKGRATPLPVIFFYDPVMGKPDNAAFAGLALIGTVEQATMLDGISSLLSGFLLKGGSAESLSEYCPIRTNLIIRVSPLKGDIYVRLSKDKYVKLFRSGDEFEHTDLEKYYETKKIEYMYLKRTDISEFINRFRKELEDLLARSDVKPEEALATAEMSQEAIQELVHRVGFNEEVQELAKKNVQLTLKAIGAHPRLQDLINKVTKEGNYISQHSTLLAHVSCCVAKEMEWGSDSTFNKLVLASFMHDVSLNNPQIAKINTMRELEERKSEFPEDLVKSYHLHPAKSADVVRNFKEIPADVDLIVMQHHERPNGTGFPRGLAHNYVAPLGALFIISHDLTQAIMERKEAFSLPDFVEDKKTLFNQGNFKKVMAVLEKVKL